MFLGFRPVLRAIVAVARFRGRRLNETIRNAFRRNYAMHRNPFIPLSICNIIIEVRFVPITHRALIELNVSAS